MNIGRIVQFSEVSKEVWDKWAFAFNDSSYLHSHFYIRWLESVLTGARNETFAWLDDRDEPIALVPWAVNGTVLQEVPCRHASWTNEALGIPLIRAESPAERRRLVRCLFEHLGQRINEAAIDRVVFRRHPITLGVMNGTMCPAYQGELLAQGFSCELQNNLVLDLRKGVDGILREMTQTFRSDLRKAGKKNLTVQVFHGDGAEAVTLFRQYEHAHFVSAGRKTRPQASFDLMCEYLKDAATLFVAYFEGRPISWLYCFKWSDFAISYSQVNLDEFEKVLPVRHLLEFEAVKHYIACGVRFYEIGTRLYGPQLTRVPSAKQLSIAFFKERFGGDPWPDLTFERFYSREKFEAVFTGRLRQFVDSDYFTVPSLQSVS